MRLHLHLHVNDLDASIRFYSAMFNSEPTTRKDDYAKWLLDEPSVNFSITHKAEGTDGLQHLGIQADSKEELDELYTRVDRAEGEMREEGDTVCCYAKSTKGWVKDPQQIEWEMFYTYGESETFYAPEARNMCCQPKEGVRQ